MAYSNTLSNIFFTLNEIITNSYTTHPVLNIPKQADNISSMLPTTSHSISIIDNSYSVQQQSDYTSFENIGSSSRTTPMLQPQTLLYTNSHDNPIEKRYKQLYSPMKDYIIDKKLSMSDVECIANNIEAIFSQSLQNDVYYFNRKQYRIPLSLLFDKENSQIFILLKNHLGDGQAEGSFKKVTKALLVPHDSQKPCYFMAQKRSRDIFEMNQVDEAKQEITIQKKFGYETSNLFTYAKQKNNFLRWTIFEPFFQKSLYNIIQENISLNEDQIISVAEQLIEQLINIHQRNSIHGDIKLQNILMNMTSTGKIEACYTDFGLSYNVLEGTPNWLVLKGYYGSIQYTAPESFGVSIGDNDRIEKHYNPYIAEVWALGFLLHELLFDRDSTDRQERRAYKKHKTTRLPFDIPMKTFYEIKNKAVYRRGELKIPIEDEKSRYQRNIMELYDRTLQRVNDEKKQNPSFLTYLKCVIVGFIDPDPNARMSLEQGLKILQTVQEDIMNAKALMSC